MCIKKTPAEKLMDLNLQKVCFLTVQIEDVSMKYMIYSFSTQIEFGKGDKLFYETISINNKIFL